MAQLQGRDYTSQLPDSCLLDILSRLSLADLLSSSAVCKRWHQVTQSPWLYRRLLPDGYTQLLDLDYPGPREESALCDQQQGFEIRLLRHLCTTGVRFQNGGLCMRQDPRTQLVTLTASSADHLGVYLLHRPQRWWEAIPNTNGWLGSDFPHVAFLRSVCWFDTGGELAVWLPTGRYSAAWKVSSPSQGGARREAGPDDPYPGAPVRWGDEPALSRIEIQCNNQTETIQASFNMQQAVASLPAWSHLVVGEFEVLADAELNGDSPSREGCLVRFRAHLRAVEQQKWKSNLFLDGLVIKQLTA